MSLFAGIYSLTGASQPPGEIMQTMRAEFARAHASIDVFQDKRVFLAKLDLGCFGSPAFVTGTRVVAATGEPLLTPCSPSPPSRAEDIEYLASSLRLEDTSLLRRCAGSFSICLYDRSTGDFLLSTDRLGIRPVYYSVLNEFLVFSSNLRVLESIPALDKTMDSIAVTEIAMLGIPLAHRTGFLHVHNLRGSQVLSCRSGKLQLGKYFNWSEIPRTTLNREEFLDVLHDTFLTAIGDRAARAPQAVSFLSGGLDSRVIVSGLRQLGKTVYTLGFDYPGLLDGALAKSYAAEIGTIHKTIEVDHTQRDRRRVQALAPRTIDYAGEERPEFPSLVFSGDGGSVGLGFVYMDEHLVCLLRANRLSEAVAYYLRNRALPRRLIRGRYYTVADRIVRKEIQHEILLGEMKDAAKNFHIFLQDNDQRRHLHSVYEEIDTAGVEFLLPFMDGRFLELIASAPVDWFLGHDFYHKWLSRFPEATKRIPWQTYPGHLPCPIALPIGLRAQWDLTPSERYSSNRASYDLCKRALFKRGFPGRILRREIAALSVILHGLKFRNMGYILDACRTFVDFHRRCGGKMSLLEADDVSLVGSSPSEEKPDLENERDSE